MRRQFRQLGLASQNVPQRRALQFAGQHRRVGQVALGLEFVEQHIQHVAGDNRGFVFACRDRTQVRILSQSITLAGVGSGFVLADHAPIEGQRLRGRHARQEHPIGLEPSALQEFAAQVVRQLPQLFLAGQLRILSSVEPGKEIVAAGRCFEFIDGLRLDE
ncbi:hypothetical protein D3C76_1126500 [compost metagenome]